MIDRRMFSAALIASAASSLVARAAKAQIAPGVRTRQLSTVTRPRFYLRGSVGEKELLLIFDRNTKEPYRSKPYGVAAQRDFNRIEVERAWRLPLVGE